MEKKTFKDLKIGDTIYKIYPTNTIVKREYDTGNIIEKSTVRYLDINKNGNLRINRHDGYHDTTYEYVISPETAAKTSFETNNNSIVFADKRLAYQLVRKQVLSGIKDLESKIPAMIRQVEEDIRSVRERYFNILNGPEYDLTAEE